VSIEIKATFASNAALQVKVCLILLGY